MLRDSIAKFFKVDSLIGNLTGYVETRIELVKVEAKEELAKGLSTVIVFLLLAFIVALVIVFVSVGIALRVGEALGNLAAFSIVAAFYAIAAGIVAWKREEISRSLETKFNQMLNKKKR